MTPRWLRELPFWSSISLVFYGALFCACSGVVVILWGAIVRDGMIIAGGSFPVVTFSFFLFVLWKTYIDDGYWGR